MNPELETEVRLLIEEYRAKERVLMGEGPDAIYAEVIRDLENALRTEAEQIAFERNEAYFRKWGRPRPE